MLSPFCERETIIDWVYSQPTALDLAFSLHVPASLRWQEQGWDELWLSKRLKHFFTDLDRKALGAANRRKHLRMDRLVVLHQSPNVGWHAHCQITTPKRLSQGQLSSLAERLWLRSLGPHARGKFSSGYSGPSRSLQGTCPICSVTCRRTQSTGKIRFSLAQCPDGTAALRCSQAAVRRKCPVLM